MPQTTGTDAPIVAAPFDIRTLTDQEAHEFALAIAAMAQRLTATRRELITARAEVTRLTGANKGLHERLDTLQAANITAGEQHRFGHLAGRPDGFPGLTGFDIPSLAAERESLFPFRWRSGPERRTR